MTHIVTVCNCLLSEGTDWRVGPLKNSKKKKKALLISNKQESCSNLQRCGQHFYLMVICGQKHLTDTVKTSRHHGLELAVSIHRSDTELFFFFFRKTTDNPNSLCAFEA